MHATIAGVALAGLTPARPVNGRRVLEELEHRLHPLVSFLVLPLFALANAGVALGDAHLGGDEGRVAIAVALGLVVGKLLGIAGATLVTLRLRLGTLPEGVGPRTLLGIGALAGIGFTVSLFIAPLAYSDPELIAGAKVGILAGSLVSALIGVAILMAAPSRRPPG